VYKERAFVKSKIRNATSKNTHHDKDTDSADKKRQKSPVRRSLRARRVEGAIASLLKKKKKKKREKEEHRGQNHSRGKRTSLFPVSFRATVEPRRRRRSGMHDLSGRMRISRISRYIMLPARMIAASYKPTRHTALYRVIPRARYIIRDVRLKHSRPAIESYR